MNLTTKICWGLAIFTFLFVFLPAVLPDVPRDPSPKQEVYDGPLLCYKGEVAYGDKKLICNYPATPTGLMQSTKGNP